MREMERTTLRELDAAKRNLIDNYIFARDDADEEENRMVRSYSLRRTLIENAATQP